MNENIVAFGKRAPDTERRAEFINHFAAAYDDYVAQLGYEPEAAFHVFTGCTQATRSGWMVKGNSEGAASPLLALAGLALSQYALGPVTD